MVRACANASALQCIMMTALQILESVTRPRLVAPQYIAWLFSGDKQSWRPGRRRAGLEDATKAIIGSSTYQDLPTLTQHYGDLSRSEPTNSLRTPLIRVVWVYRETQ